MNTVLGPDALAVLLLTAPLGTVKSRYSVSPLSPREYSHLARQLRETGRQPADLLDPALLNGLEKTRLELDIERVRKLLGRTFLLSLTVKHWHKHSIWVVTRADHDYPKRLKMRLKEIAPPVLYGCGNRDSIDRGGLAVVGSRRVGKDLLQYTKRAGRLAAEAQLGVVSGGARGVDQAAMSGALAAGGQVLGVLASGLERTAWVREYRALLNSGQLVLVSPYEPAAEFLARNALARNKLIYALADAALVVKSDLGFGGTWRGAIEQLNKRRYVPVYVRRSGARCAGLDELFNWGAEAWPDPRTATELRDILSSDASRVLDPAADVQPDLLWGNVPDETGTREVP